LAGRKLKGKDDAWPCPETETSTHCWPHSSLMMEPQMISLVNLRSWNGGTSQYDERPRFETRPPLGSVKTEYIRFYRHL
jgi:hypothetical protein